MGILRLYLAIIVLDWHWRFSDLQLFPYSFTAVCCFFVISGFYISMVINEKYGVSRAGLTKFYLNRALRLLPVNFAVLVGFVVVQHYNGFHLLPFMPLSKETITIKALYIINQILIFPYSVWSNLTLKPGVAYLASGQMYTVGLEIMFYIIAPFIVARRLIYLLPIAIAAIALHFALGWDLPFPSREWQYDFFPGVLGFFMLGVLSYRIWLIVSQWRYPKWIGYAFLPMFCAYCIYAHDNSLIRFTNDLVVDGMYGLIAIGIPFLFEASKSSSWDKWIGDLSYPFYAVQYLVGESMVGWAGSGTYQQNFRVMLMTLISSIALLIVVDRPIDTLRRRISSNGMRVRKCYNHQMEENTRGNLAPYKN